jgi:hypothetical protein
MKKFDNSYYQKLESKNRILSDSVSLLDIKAKRQNKKKKEESKEESKEKDSK